MNNQRIPSPWPGRMGFLVTISALAFMVYGALYVFTNREEMPAQAQDAQQQQADTVTPTPAPTSTPTLNPDIPAREAALRSAAEAQAVAEWLQVTIVAAQATSEEERRRDQYGRDVQATIQAQETAVIVAAEVISRTNMIAQAQAVATVEAIETVQEFEKVKPALKVAAVFALMLIGAVVIALVINHKMKTPQPVAVEDYEDEPSESIIEVSANNGRTIQRAKATPAIMRILPVFADYAMSLEDDTINPLTDDEWAGEDKRGVTKPDWYAFRNWLIANRFAAWKNESAHAQGAELTESGWALMKRIANDDAPSPTELGLQ